MRILYLGSFQRIWHTECYIANALTGGGHDCIRLEESTATQASIVDRAAEIRPDLLLFAKARFREANHGWPADARAVRAMIAAVRPFVRQVACWVFDLLAPAFSTARFEWAREVAADCDLFATTDGFTAGSLPNAAVVRQGVPDDVEHDAPWPEDHTGDVFFLGTAYGERGRLVAALAERFSNRFRCVGNCRGSALTRLVRGYRVCVGPHEPHYAGYWSNRIYVVTGHGGLFAAPAVPGMEDEGWQAGRHFIELPREPAAMGERLAEIIRDEPADALRQIQLAGYHLATERFSYRHRVAELLARLNRASK
jgi:hypothetical protein